MNDCLSAAGEKGDLCSKLITRNVISKHKGHAGIYMELRSWPAGLESKR